MTASNQSKGYGTIFDLGSTAFTATGLLNSDSIAALTLSSPGTVASATVAGGPYAIAASNAVGFGLSNYVVSYANGVLKVNPALITGIITAANKVYDGSSAAVITSANLQGAFYGADGSNLTLNVGSASFNSPNVSNATTVTASGLTLSGAAVSNYALVSSSAATPARITPRALTIAANGASQIYGNSAPPLTYTVGGLGLVGSDQLTGTLVTDALPTSRPAATTSTWALTPTAVSKAVWTSAATVAC